MYKILMSWYMGWFAVLLVSAIVSDYNVLSCIGGVAASYAYLTN